MDSSLKMILIVEITNKPPEDMVAAAAIMTLMVVVTNLQEA